MDIEIRLPHISVLSVTNRDYGTGPVSGSERCQPAAIFGRGWLLAERAARNDIPDNGLRTFRNLIAFFS
jgi:hypothetical protein